MGAELVFTEPFTSVVDQTPCKASDTSVWLLFHSMVSFPLLPAGTTNLSLKSRLLEGRVTAVDPNPLMVMLFACVWVFNANNKGFRSTIPRKVNAAGFCIANCAIATWLNRFDRTSTKMVSFAEV